MLTVPLMFLRQPRLLLPRRNDEPWQKNDTMLRYTWTQGITIYIANL